MDYTVHGILQARILKWVAFPFSRGSSQPRDQTQVPFIDEGTETQGLNDVPVGLTAEVWTAEPSTVLSFG